jgi:serine/threonine protein kinase
MNANRDELLADVEDDPRVLQASREYLAELEAGRKPDRAAILSRYPDLTETLSECFDGIDLAQSLRPPVMASQSELTASPIGDFQIIREIGRGGMGIVYEAVQLSLGRRVALKVLPFASALDARHLQRFKNEAQAAAQLHHTNIVPVYAVGCERGVHFYAMQLIDGRPLSEVIRELRESAADPVKKSMLATTVGDHVPTTNGKSELPALQRSGRDRGSFRTAARICAQVADALEYAHEAGVVHRDIKPGNLLLDVRGNVWITDFGLAQVAADVNVTQTGDVVGTLRYMSPEQAAGRRTPVDHRADVYSLGATLYEWLTLQPIFTSEDRVTLLNQILNEEPRPLRELDRSIPIELETIVLKAIAKSPMERYATAGELAADLRRFLEERPILARRPTVLDHARKWLRRHPSFIVTAVVLLICGIVGLSVTTALVARERDETQRAYQREAQRAAEAEARFKLARRAADEMIHLAEDGLSDNPFQEGLRKRLLETALEYYQEFIAQRSSDPNAQAELAITSDHVKKILDDLAVVQADRQTVLLRESEVLDDLQVPPAKRTEIAELLERHEEQRRELFRDPRSWTSSHHRQRTVAMARENEAALAAILSPEQLARLRQIALQCQGVRALREHDVAKALGLSTEQKERIRAIEAEVLWTRGSSSRTASQAGESFSDRVRTSMRKSLEVLTAEQRQQWQAMIGRPYQGPLFFQGRQSGGGPPRR